MKRARISGVRRLAVALAPQLTIMFGLAFATVLTLIFVPVLYAIFFRFREGQETREAKAHAD